MLLILIGTTTLNYALKKQQTKNQQKKILHKTVNFCSPNLTKPKKKSKNTTNCHNIFTIPLFPAIVSLSLIYYYLFYRNAISIILNKPKIIVTFIHSLNKCHNIFTKHLFSVVGHSLIFYYFILTYKKLIPQ